jgi:hypothetical protein
MLCSCCFLQRNLSMILRCVSSSIDHLGMRYVLVIFGEILDRYHAYTIQESDVYNLELSV